MSVITKHQVLEWVRDKKIAPEEGFELIKSFSPKAEEGGYTGDEIAVVGMAGQFPGAESVDEFWNILKENKCTVTDIPKGRWNWSEWARNNDLLKNKLKKELRGGFLKNLAGFDAPFFGLSKVEAEYMDPSQRLFIQEAWKALEDAGYTSDDLYGKMCGVFVGCQEMDYLKYYDGAISPYLSTGSSKSVLASRVSYYLNLKGPAVSIDTACSSALSALHIACGSLQDKTCDMALVGGVLTLSTPAMFTGLASLNIFSPNGVCRVFDKNADGTVIGEAVGVVVIKRLKDAKKDGDHIYGLIRKTGWNQDGKTSGITAPSAVSQTELEKSVYKNAGINPESISYIETHGTGTKLGDPIEIQALTDAFSTFTSKKNFCAVGSVKSNIGHTMPAAGIVSLIKVLLCIKNRMLVPSANFTEANPLIGFEKSPFYVNRELKEWKAQGDEPLRAAISSFGFSGTNCHVIVEEYQVEDNRIEEKKACFLFPFSAKTRQALLKKEQDMEAWLCDHLNQYSTDAIESTLCLGRSHMKYRSCIVAKNQEELLSVLRKRLEDSESSYYFNENKLSAEEGTDKCDGYVTYARNYIRSGVIDEAVLKTIKRNIISLPNYPFVLKKYWIYEDKDCVQIKISGNEYFTKNHVVYGEPIIPGAMQVVMSMRAAKKLLGRNLSGLKNVVWMQPVKGEHIAGMEFRLKNKTDYRYELSCGEVVSQGELEISHIETDRNSFPVDQIKKDAEKILSHEVCYEYFNKRGLDYGEGFCSISKLYASRDHALAVLENPEVILDDEEKILCTCIDAAFQASMGIMGDGIRKENDVNVPFFMESIHVFGIPGKFGYVYAELSQANRNFRLKKYNMYILDENGKVLIEISNFSMKPIERKAEILLLKESLHETRTLDTGSKEDQKVLMVMNQKILPSHIKGIEKASVVKTIDSIKENDFSGYDVVMFVNKASERQNASVDWIKEEIQNWVKRVIETIKMILCRKKSCKILYHVYGENVKKDYINQAMSGFVNTLNAESHKSAMKLVVWQQKNVPTYDKMLSEKNEMQEGIVYRLGNKRYRKELRFIDQENNHNEYPQKGLYVITGGSGVLGRKVAKHLVDQYEADVVLVGRRKPENLDRLSESMKYIQADVSEETELDRMFVKVREFFGDRPIDGIIHCAGVIKDSYIIKKEMREINEVFKPKVYASLILYEKAVQEGVRKVLFFSSLAAVFGNPGQADYAYANGFLNHFAENCPKAYSISWPSWKNGGMNGNEMSQRETQKEIGLLPITDAKGMEALDQIIRGEEKHVIVLYGNKNKLAERLNIVSESERRIEGKDMIMIENTEMNLTDELMDMASGFVSGNEDVMKVEDDIQDYGFDSVTLTAFCNAINDRLHIKLTPASFFELDAPNIKALSKYISEVFPEKVKARYCNKEIEQNKNVKNELEKKGMGRKEAPAEPEQEIEQKKQSAMIKDGVAIIGMSAVMPQSEDIKEFWENLIAKKELVGEFPEDRELYLKGVTCAHRAGFIKDVGQFDPEFFNMSMREAGNLDPQVRLIIELIWKAFEDAGYDPKDYSGKKVGVYLGISSSDYCDLIIKSETKMDASLTLGISNSLRANRISYLYDFKGPSEPIDTACSSSLIALHHGAEALKAGSCDYAVVAGVNVILTPTLFNSFNSAGMLSEGGKCKAFDENADGYVRGEGAGVILLKPFEKAEKEKDDIYAVVRATTENHGGHAKSITSPNANAQAQLIYDAYKKAEIDPSTVTYLETHGTGTSIGDPVEINGIKKAFKMLFYDIGEELPKEKFCGFGALKPNIGHLEAASGIAGVIKVVMAMKNHILPATINFQKLNPYIELEDTPFYIVSENTDWNRRKDRNGKEIPLRAGISAFGYGGSNAHVVLEEYVKPKETACAKKERLFVFSAKTERSLKEYVKGFVSYLDCYGEEDELKNLLSEIITVNAQNIDESADIVEYCKDNIQLTMFTQSINEKYHTNLSADYILEAGSIEKLKQIIKKDTINLAKVAYVLKCGRHHMEHRIAVPAENMGQLKQYLKNYLTGNGRELFTAEQDSCINVDEELRRIAARFVKGDNVDFKEEYGQENPGKLHLPTYAFEKNFCWFASRNKYIQVGTKMEQAAERKVEKATLTLKKLPEREEIAVVENMEEVGKIKNELRKMISDVLYVDQSKIDDTRPFKELGVDSILGVEIVRKIKEAYQVNIKATKIYDYSDVNQLATYIAKLTEPHRDITKVTEMITDCVAEKKDKSTLTLKKHGESNIPESEKRVKYKENSTGNWKDIAVIGMSIKFPMSDDMDEFWDNLKEGKDCISEVPLSRWDAKAYKNNKDMYCEWGGFLNDVDKFDPLFFNLSPADAIVMDPQQRLFIMGVWKALEDAGYSKEKLDTQNCGIYAGVMTHSDYADSMFNSHSMLAARVAYYLNLKGPAVSLDTACSSSLVATHMACRSLIDGDSDMMVAGGVTLYLSPKMYMGMESAGMLAHDGKCKVFDNSADGFVPGEGVSVVVLKLLEKAVEDGDHIYGIIKGSGINQDGRTNGITAPSAMSQTKLECSIYDKCGISPESIQYVECHGTGTKLGDPIEVDALTEAFRNYTDKKHFCRIGSMKSNFGHTSAASGVGSLIKVLLSMEHELIPQTIHYRIPNSHINFEDSPFIVNSELVPWQTKAGEKKRAAISAFGYSGTNAHIVVEEYKEDRKKKDSEQLYIACLSGKTKEIVNKRVNELKRWISLHKNQVSIQDVCYTLNERRTHFDERICFVIKSMGELSELLEDYLTGNHSNRILSGNANKKTNVGFIEKQLQAYIVEQMSKYSMGSPDYTGCVMAIAEMYTKGYAISWEKIFGENSGKVVSLPTYPFELKSYWKEGTPVALEPVSKNVLCGKKSTDKSGDYEIILSGNEFFIEDNVVYGKKVVPGVAYLEMVKASLEKNNEEKITQIKDLYWLDMIDVNHGTQKVVLHTQPQNDGGSFEITTEVGKKLNVQGNYSFNKEVVKEYENEIIDVDAFIASASTVYSGRECYEGYKNRLFTIGSRLQSMKKMYCKEKEALSVLKLPEKVVGTDEYTLHPSIMDSMLQTATGLQLNAENSKLGNPYISFCIREVIFVRDIKEECYAYARMSDNESKSKIFRSFDIKLLDSKGRVLVVIKQFGIKKSVMELENEREQEKIILPSDIRKQYEEDILKIIKDLLKMTDEEIDPKVELLEYGFSSITLILFINIVKEKYKIEVDTAMLLDHDELTTEVLANSLYEKFEQKIQKVYGDSSEAKSLKIIYEEMLEKLISQFKKSTLVNNGCVDAEEVKKVEEFLSKEYNIPICACKLKKKASFADMIKDFVCRNKGFL